MTDLKERVADHRRRNRSRGVRRVEVTVPVDDAPLVRQFAAALRAGGPAASRLREQTMDRLGERKAVSGEDLVTFFRNSPLVDVELSFERDRSTGRPVELD